MESLSIGFWVYWMKVLNRTHQKSCAMGTLDSLQKLNLLRLGGFQCGIGPGSLEAELHDPGARILSLRRDKLPLLRSFHGLSGKILARTRSYKRRILHIAGSVHSDLHPDLDGAVDCVSS